MQPAASFYRRKPFAIFLKLFSLKSAIISRDMNQGDGKLRYKDFAIPKAVLLLLVVTTAFSAQAARPGWKSEKVNWRMTGGRRIKAVNYP